MAPRGRKLPGRGGHRGRLRGGRRGGVRGHGRGGHRGGRGRARHQEGARGGRPRGPGRRRLRAHWRQRPLVQIGLFPGRKSKSAEARDDMNFVDKYEKASAAIADAIEEGSSTSSEEYIRGPPLEVEEDKMRQEEARKEKEAKKMREQEEEARLRKEAEEQEERKRGEARRMKQEARLRKEHDAKKRDEEEARPRRKEQQINEEDEARWRREELQMYEEARHRREQLRYEEEDARWRLEERRKEEEEKIRRLIEERKRLDEENAFRQLEEERKLVEAQKAAEKTPTREHTPVNEKPQSLSPITRQIMDVVGNIEKMSTKTERPAMVEASTETGNDVVYEQPQQGGMRDYQVQTVPMRRPVASYVIKRPRSETRLQRLLSFFGLASPEQPDQEVIEYNFIEPTARWSPYEDRQDRPVRYEEGYQRSRKGGKEMRRQGEYGESPESSDSEEGPEDLDANVQDNDTRKQRRKRCGRKKKSKHTQRHDVRKDGRPMHEKMAEITMDQRDMQKVSAMGGSGVPLQKLSGMGYVEEVTEEVMEPQRNYYGQAVGPRIRKMRVVRPLDTLCAGPLPRQTAQPRSTSDWKARPEPTIDDLWTRPRIWPSAEQAEDQRIKDTNLQQELNTQGVYPANVDKGTHRPPAVPFPPTQFQPPLMPRTLCPWDIRQPLAGGHGYYAGDVQAPSCQVHYSPPHPPSVFQHSPGHCTLTKFPSPTSLSTVCTCVVKCGDHCIGLGRRKSDVLEPTEPNLRSSTSIHKYESPRSFDDTAPIHREPLLWAESRRREDLEARIRAEDEVRLLTRKLRLLETHRDEGKAHLDELREEEQALQLERQLLEGELDRLKERRQADEYNGRQNMGLIAQISRIEERLRRLEHGQNAANKGSSWTREGALPVVMPWPYAVPVYGLPAPQIPPDNTSWWTRQRGRHARRCSDAGSESSGSRRPGTGGVSGGREAAWKSNESFAWNTTKLFEDVENRGNSLKQDIPILGRLIPLFSSSQSFADKPSGKHVSYKQETSVSQLEPAVNMKAGLGHPVSEQEAGGKTGDAASRANDAKYPAVNNMPFTTSQLEPEVPDVVFVKHRKSISPQAMRRNMRVPSRKGISTEIDSLLSALTESDSDSLPLAQQKAKSKKEHKRGTKRGTDSSSNTFSDSSSVTPAQTSNGSRKSGKSVSRPPKTNQWWDWSSAGSRLLGALIPTSPKKDSVPKTRSVAPVPSVAPRKRKPIAPQKPPDELSLEEAVNEELYTTEDFINQMKGGSVEKLREASSCKSGELGTLQLDESVKDMKSKSTESKDAMRTSIPKPPPVAVRSKLSKGVTKEASENVHDGDVQSHEEPPRDQPLPLPGAIPDLSEKCEQSAELAPETKTNTPEKTPARKKSAPGSETPATQHDSVLVCNVLTPCGDEFAAEKDMFAIMETPQDLFPERSFVSLVSLLTLLWITVVLSTTTFLSPKLTADAPANTTTVTRSSYSDPKTSARTTHVPSLYLCDSDYCTREGNFLKGLLSEADYPCEDFYEHICQRWTQRRSAEVTRGGTISEDVFLEDRMEHIILSSLKENAAKVKPAAKFMATCVNSASSASVDDVREVFKHWRIREWPVRSYEERQREDVWFFAGELLRDMGLPVLADVYVAVDPFNARKGVTTLKRPEPPYFTRDAVSDLADRAVKETLRAFNLSDLRHIERLTNEIMMVSDVLERLGEDSENPTLLRDCELDRDVLKLLSTAVDSHPNGKKSTRCTGKTYVQLHSAKYFKKLPEEIRRVAVNALFNHLGFRVLVRLSAFLPDSLRALRELSYLEITGRSEVPDTESLCLRAMEAILPLCLVKSAALPLIHDGTALWQRRWLSDLETTFLHALPRVPWLDERALFVLAFRLRRIRMDPPFSVDMVQENATCLPVGLVVGNTLADILGLFRKMRTRRTALELRSGPEWHPLSPLSMWPSLDAALRRIRIPQGLLNNSVPANSSIFAFHLSRVAVRFYASMVPLLYSSFQYDREAALDLGPESKSLLKSARSCLEDDWRALFEQKAAVLPAQYDLIDHQAQWLRRWLLEQTLAIEMALHAFRELLNVRRIWKLQYGFVTLPDYTSTQLFFMYYALDHCQRDFEGFERRQLLERKLPPAKMRVNLPLRHVGAFADAFGCRHGDQMRADQPCTVFIS